MKVLFFTHSMAAGGAERVVATLANHWARQGWSVCIVTIAGEDMDFYELDPTILRSSLGFRGESSNSVAGLLNNLRRVIALRRILRAHKPFAAISMMSTANCVLALARSGLGIRAIGSERTHPPRFPLGAAWEAVRRYCYPKLDAVVVQTVKTAEWMLQHVPGTELAIIPNPVQLPLPRIEPTVDPDVALGQQAGAHRLLAVGRLDEYKGFDRLLRAFAATFSAPSWVLVIVGEGAERIALQRLAESLGISDRVFLPGAIGNIGDWYASADMFVLTSRYEGFPNCLLEAMAHGLASVAIDCETGPAEIIRHEFDGLLVPEGDDNRLIEAIDRLMQDDALRTAFGENAAKVRERFTVDRIAAQWADELEKVRS